MRPFDHICLTPFFYYILHDLSLLRESHCYIERDEVIRSQKQKKGNEKMSEEITKSRKGQVHRTWSKKLIDEIKEKVEKYSEVMGDEIVQNFLDFMETVDKKIKETKRDKSYDMMVGRYKKMSKEDFKKMIERQYAAFKDSRVKSEKDEFDDLLEGI